MTADRDPAPAARRIRASSSGHASHARRAPRRRFDLAAIAALVLCAAAAARGTASVRADDAVRTGEPRLVRRVYVPADRPEAWLDRARRIVELPHLEALLAKERAAATAQDGPSAARIRHAVYSASFVDGALVGGRLRFDVDRTRAAPDLLVLEPLDLALEEPTWHGREAHVGTLPDGRIALLADRPSGSLEARWTLRGRPHVRYAEFDLRLAPATASRIEIDLPPDHVPTCSVGTVSPPSSADPASAGRWTIELGSRTECRLAIGPRTSRPRLAPTLLTRTDHQFVAAPEGLRFQSDFELDVADAAVSRLTFQVAQGVQIDAASYGDFPLNWSETPAGPARRIAIDLPDAVAGPARNVRLVGTAPLPASGRSVLPHPELVPAPDAPGSRVVFLGGRFHLSTRPPIVSRSVQAAGLRQVSQTIDPAGGETLSFAQFEPDARLAVEWGRPEPRISARIWEHVDLSADAGDLVGEFEWQASAGASFTAAWDVPDEWRVTEVRAVPDQPRQAIVRFQELGRKEGRRRWSVEFQDALRPGFPKTVQIFARRTSGGAARPLLPVLRPIDADVAETIVACTAPAGARALSHPAGAYMPLENDAVPTWVRSSGLWKDPVDDARRRTTLLHSRGHGPSVGSGVEIVSGNAVEAAVALVRCDVEEDAFVERLVLRVALGETSRPQIAVLVPRDDGPPWEWAPTSAAGTTGVSAVRSPTDPRRTTTGPLSADRWELRFAEPQSGTATIAARRSRPLQSVVRVAPPRPVDVGEFAALVETSTEAAAGRHVSVVDASAPVPDAIPTGVAVLLSEAPADVRRWLVPADGPAAELRIADARGTGAELDGRWASLDVRSFLASRTGQDDLHEALFRFRRRGTVPFDFVLPSSAGIVSVDVEGIPAVLHSTLEGFSVDVPRDLESGTVRIRWRTRASHGFPTLVHDTTPPRSSFRIASFRHDFAVPPGTELVSEPPGLRRLAAPVPLPWTRRLFGPLGRRADEPVFNPFAPALREVPARDRESETADRRENLSPTDETAAARDDAATELPPGWTRIRCEAPVPPDAIVVRTTDSATLAAGAWTALAGCLAIGALLRRIRWPGRAVLGALCATAGLAAAWLVPPPWTPIAGGALVGVLIASLLSRTVVDRLLPPPSQPASGFGSTLTMARPAGMLLLAALLAPTAAIALREASAEEIPSAGSDRTRADADRIPQAILDDPATILVPVRTTDDDPRSAPRPLGVAYVQPALWDRLAAFESRHTAGLPPLVTRAVYEATIDDDRTVRIEAVLRVVVPAPTSGPVVLLWPLAEANPVGDEACRVDGRMVPLRRGPGPGLLAIDVPSHRPTKNASDTQDAKSADHETDALPESATATMPEVHEIRLTLRPAATLEPGGGRVRFAVPPTCDAAAAIRFARSQRTVSLPGARGPLPAESAIARAKVQLGRTDRLELAWSAVPPAARQAVEAVATLSALAEVRPGVVELQYLVEIDVAKGTLDDLEWIHPHGLVLRSIQSPDLLAHVPVAADAAGSRVLLEFRRPLAGPVRLAAQFLWPVPGSGSTVRIPPLDMAFVPAHGAAPLRIAQHRLGLIAPADFEAAPAPLDPERAKPLSPDLFVRLGTATSGGTAPRRPQFAWELARPVPVPVALRTRRPVRRAVLRQTGRFDEHGLHWAVRADIDTSEAPAFRHAIEVPAALRIESLVVRADGANRAARWFRKGDLVEVLLTEQTTGRQQLVLDGRLDGDPRVARPLPFVRIAEAETLESTFVLGLARPGELRIAGGERLARSDPPGPGPGLAPPAGEPRPDELRPVAAQGPFVAPGPGEPLSASAAFAPEGVPLDVVSFVPVDSNGRPFLLAIRVSRSTAPVGRRVLTFRIADADKTVPAPEIVSSTTTRRIQRRPDGSLDVTLEGRPSDAAPPSCTLVWRADRTQPLPALPDIRFDDDVSAPQLLVVDPRVALPPPRDAAEPLDAADVPDGILAWMRELVPESPAPLAFRIEHPGRWPAPTTIVAAVPAAERVPLVQDRLWLDPDGTVRGWSSFRIDSRRTRVAFDLPDGTEPHGLFVEDEPQRTHRAPDGRLVAALPESGGPRTVRIAWTRPQPESASAFGALDCPLPEVVDLPVDERLAVLLPPADRWTIARRGTKRLERQEFVEARLAAEATSPRRAPAAPEARTAPDSPPRAQPPTATDEVAPVGPSALLFEAPPAHDGFGAGSRNPVWVRLPTGNGPARFSCWLLDERPLLWIGVLSVAALLHALVVVRLYRAASAKRTPARRTFAWLALGGLWWLCLAPSWLGPVWIAGAVFEWWPKRGAGRDGRDRSRSDRGSRAPLPTA